MTTAATVELPTTPDLTRAEFEFERARNEEYRSANREFIRERFAGLWTVVHEGGQLAAFDDPQEFLAFLSRLGPFAADSASARPPWRRHGEPKGREWFNALPEPAKQERKRNFDFWRAHERELIVKHPHRWIIVYGGGEVMTAANQRELWVLQNGCDPLTWALSVQSSPRKPRPAWIAKQPPRSANK